MLAACRPNGAGALFDGCFFVKYRKRAGNQRNRLDEMPNIQRDPLKLQGALNVNGLRITPETIVGNFEAGLDIAEIHEQFHGVCQ